LDVNTLPTTSIESVCRSTKVALITHGHGIGKRVNVCTDRECPVHHPQRAHTPDPEWEARQKAAQKEKEERDKQRVRRQKRFAALISRMPTSLNEEQTRFMLGALVLGDLDRSCEAMAMRHVEDEDTNKCAEDVCARILANLDTPSLPSLFAELALGSHTELPRAEQSDLLETAERLFPSPRVTKAKAAETTSLPTVPYRLWLVSDILVIKPAPSLGLYLGFPLSPS
jgi:hypothetical protein